MRFAITSAPKITASPGKSFDASAKKAAPKTTAFVAIAGNQFLNTDFGAANFLAVAPAGTRTRGSPWRSGFYHIAHAAGMPIPPDHLDTATEILDALYQLDARLALRDLDGIIPELRWDARWSDEGAAQ